MASRFLGGLLSRKKTVEIKEGDEASIRKQIEDLIGPHRLEVANFLKDKRGESILGYAQYLAKTYTDDSLSEIFTHAPGLVVWEYADQHGSNLNDNFDDQALVGDCFKDAVFDGEPLADMYEFENAKDLKSVSWDDLWADCGMALEDEAKKEKYESLQLEFSDETRTLSCFVALVLIASDLHSQQRL